MVILRMKIEHFGALQNREFTPNDGLYMVYGRNETGKSTTAEFIRAMLYGMPAASRVGGNLRDNERTRYMPFKGTVMSGSMDLENDGKFYNITCKFGRRKSEDKVTMTNSITGGEIDLEGRTPGEFLTGLTAQAFSKMNYIKQLYTSIKADKDDEILKRLVNLAQTGDEQTSYKKAVTLLEEAIREISNRGGKGKLPELKERLSTLYSEKNEAQRHNVRVNADEKELFELEEEKRRLENEKIDTTLLNRYREKFLGWQAERKHAEFKRKIEAEAAGRRRRDLARIEKTERIRRTISLIASIVIAILTSAALYDKIFLTLLLPLVCSILLFVRSVGVLRRIKSEFAEMEDSAKLRKSNVEHEFTAWFKENLGVDKFEDISIEIEKYEAQINERREKNTREIVRIAEHIRDIKNSLLNKTIRPLEEIEAEIAAVNSEIKRHEDNLADLSVTREVLSEAFSELQMDFGPKLNRAAGKVLRKVTLGKYKDMKVDENYGITVVDSNDREIKGEYLSSGAYDQIYFSLRMGIIDLLAPTVPLIMDDALTQYDDVRYNAVMEYLKHRQGQIIFFTCHKRETAGNITNIEENSASESHDLQHTV